MYNIKIIITNQNSVKNTIADFLSATQNLAILLNFAILFVILFTILENFAINIVILWNFAILIAIRCDNIIPKYYNTLQ